MKVLVILCITCVCLMTVEAASTAQSQDTTKSATTQPKKTTAHVTTPKVPVTTLTPEDQCTSANGSCDACVKVGKVQCVWCAGSSKCLLKKNAIPTSECNGLADAKWAVCWVNYEALIIACSVIGGLLILSLTICICCCCCCKKDNSAKYAKDDAKYERKKADLKAKHDDRRAERKERTDEIRRKYGLIKDDNPYQRFDDN